MVTAAVCVDGVPVGESQSLEESEKAGHIRKSKSFINTSQKTYNQFSSVHRFCMYTWFDCRNTAVTFICHSFLFFCSAVLHSFYDIFCTRSP